MSAHSMRRSVMNHLTNHQVNLTFRLHHLLRPYPQFSLIRPSPISLYFQKNLVSSPKQCLRRMPSLMMYPIHPWVPVKHLDFNQPATDAHLSGYQTTYVIKQSDSCRHPLSLLVIYCVCCETKGHNNPLLCCAQTILKQMYVITLLCVQLPFYNVIQQF